MEFMDVVMARRSVRSFSDKDIKEKDFTKMFESARIAPSWANRQCWSYILVRDNEKIKKLDGRLINSWMKHAKAIIIACGDPKKSGSRNGMEYYLVDVSISMEHLVLTATDLGLGTCWIGGFDEEKVKQILDIPEKIKVVALIPIGYPSGEGLRNKMLSKFIGSNKRKSMEKLVHYEKW
jgi:nitroreductase